MKKQTYAFLIRWYAANDRELPQWLFNACQGDPFLWSVYEAENHLSTTLKRGEDHPDCLPISGELNQRILSAIREESLTISSDAVPAHRVRKIWTTGFVCAAGLACLVAVVALNSIRTNSINDTQVQIAENSDVSPIEFGVAIDSDETWENPLDSEIDHVVADAKGAFDFLASNFLPSQLTHNLLEPEPQGDA